MSELDDFIHWVAQRKDSDVVGYGILRGSVDIFRAEQRTGQRFSRWVDAYETLHPSRPSASPS